MDWQDRLGLTPHPEGGWFRRIYTAEANLQMPHGDRAMASSIHYLLTSAAPRGRFHRVRSTILHYLQSGGPVQYACIDGEGRLSQSVLGFASGQALFLEVPAGHYKCSRLLDGADHALVSEVVLPGFDWADHEYLDVTMLEQRLRLELEQSGWLY